MHVFASPHIRLFTGAIMISFSPVWVRLVDVSPTTSGFYRVFIGGVALSLFLIATGRRLDLSRRARWILAGSAVFFALDLWFWHRSINYVGPGLSTLLANFQVFFMILAGVILLGQRPRPAQLVAFSTSSSSASLPVTIERVEHHLDVPEDISGFVLPIGATINMDGTRRPVTWGSRPA